MPLTNQITEIVFLSIMLNYLNFKFKFSILLSTLKLRILKSASNTFDNQGSRSTSTCLRRGSEFCTKKLLVLWIPLELSQLSSKLNSQKLQLTLKICSAKQGFFILLKKLNGDLKLLTKIYKKRYQKHVNKYKFVIFDFDIILLKLKKSRDFVD